MSEIMSWDRMDDAEKLAIKAMCERSFFLFMRIFFQLLQGQKFKVNWHHAFSCKLAEDVYHGKIKRGIVNVAPGSTKTEIWSIHWPAWCIVQCILGKRSSRWFPLSYSDDLVRENAGRVKEILESEEFQALWPLEKSHDTRGKSDWKFFDEHGNQHRMFGTSINGQVTGRRAGYMTDGFTGALILDDPMPPKDESSGKLMDKSNKSLNRIVRSRLAHDGVPIIMVQQRIGKGDSTDFLMSDKAPDDYEQFLVPALIDNEYLESLPPDMREACIRDTGFDGKRCSYWPDKEPTDVLLRMEKADAYMFSAQYQQAPDEALAEGVVYRKQVELLIEEGRLGPLPVEKSLPVYTFWDLGINDDMVIWLMQPHGKELRLIACYGNRDEGMEHYINWLHDFRDKYGIRYAEHMGPHDLEVRELTTGVSRIQTAKKMGITFKLVERCQSKRDSIDALRAMFDRIWIDNTPREAGVVAKGCAKGWEGIKKLRREWDHDNECFKDQVGPKWATNYTDALQQMGLHYKDQQPAKPRAPLRRPASGGWMGA